MTIKPSTQQHDTRPKRAVFFDRDGILNIDTGYTHRRDDLALIDGAPEAVRLANDLDYLAFIVTNQGGIALGLYQEEQMHDFNNQLIRIIKQQSGGVISDIAFCPHHPRSENSDLQNCDCRKPSPNMIISLAVRYNIDLSQSIMIGDRETDVQAGQAAGCQTILFTGGRLDQALKPLMSKP